MLLMFFVLAATCLTHAQSLNPSHAGSLGTTLMQSPTAIFISGNYAYVVGASGLEIIDIINVNAPVHKGNILDGSGGAVLSGPTSISVSGDFAYITSSSSNSLEVVDISNPAAPVHKSNIANGSGGALLNSPTSISISGDFAYIDKMFTPMAGM
ncbi:MAG: hypothetical protein WDN75_07845 [Bacteroidota bacterium]